MRLTEYFKIVRYFKTKNKGQTARSKSLHSLEKKKTLIKSLLLEYLHRIGQLLKPLIINDK